MVDLFIDAGALCVVCNRYMAVTPRECRVKMNLRVISTNLKKLCKSTFCLKIHLV